MSATDFRKMIDLDGGAVMVECENGQTTWLTVQHSLGANMNGIGVELDVDKLDALLDALMEAKLTMSP